MFQKKCSWATKPTSTTHPILIWHVVDLTTWLDSPSQWVELNLVQRYKYTLHKNTSLLLFFWEQFKVRELQNVCLDLIFTHSFFIFYRYVCNQFFYIPFLNYLIIYRYLYWFSECQGEDSITQPTKVQTATADETVTIDCTYKTNAFPTLYWYQHKANQAPKYMLKRFSVMRMKTLRRDLMQIYKTLQHQYL